MLNFLMSARTFIKWLLIACAAFIIFLCICVFIRVLYLRIFKKIPFGKKNKPLQFHDNITIGKLVRVLSDQFFIDKLRFPFYGTHFFSGKQGSGKTISSIRYVRAIKKAYPECILISNCYIDCADVVTDDLNVFLDIKNDDKGVILYLDEIQNSFNTINRDFPIELLGEICQQRKQAKMFVCTSQVFGRVSRPIREQCHYLIRPFTLFGCITFQICGEPEFDSDYNIKALHNREYSCYVHTPELYSSFNTYEKINRLQNIKK